MLDLKQMAAELGVSVKTFRADVRRKQIPFVEVGKRKRFDPFAVKAYLSTTETELKSNVVVMAKPRKARAVSMKFAEA